MLSGRPKKGHIIAVVLVILPCPAKTWEWLVASCNHLRLRQPLMPPLHRTSNLACRGTPKPSSAWLPGAGFIWFLATCRLGPKNKIVLLICHVNRNDEAIHVSTWTQGVASSMFHLSSIATILNGGNLECFPHHVGTKRHTSKHTRQSLFPLLDRRDRSQLEIG